MSKRSKIIWLICLFFSMVSISFGQVDKEGCKDHPMFNRMPNFYLSDCELKDFASLEFKDEKGNDIQVEGKIHRADYWIKDGFQAPSELQIIRNYENAIQKIGGVVVKEYANWGEAYLKLSKPGKTYWVLVDCTNDGAHYELSIVEKAEMAQEVIADAKSLLNDIQASGHVAVYGIYFDFNKAEIKPESEPSLKEIAKLVQQNLMLKLYVVGHTDNVGTLSYNLELSRQRAEAVVKELTTKFGVAGARLIAYGVGPLAPVSSNQTEEGRAKNRRVELVAQ